MGVVGHGLQPDADEGKGDRQGAERAAFTLAWTTLEQGNPPEAPVSVGTVSFQESPAGLINTDWSSGLPPPTFPILSRGEARATTASRAPITSSSGERAPVIAAPVVAQTTWSARGVRRARSRARTSTSASSPSPCPPPLARLAAKMRSDEPGRRDRRPLREWCANGVVGLRRGAGEDRLRARRRRGAVTTATLVSTNQAAKRPPPDTLWFPFTQGEKQTYRWSNTKHMPAVRAGAHRRRGRERVGAVHGQAPRARSGSRVATASRPGATGSPACGRRRGRRRLRRCRRSARPRLRRQNAAVS